MLRLQKKMAELETELTDVYSRPLDPTADDPRRRLSFDDVKQRFNFLRKLLAAEIESHPEATTDELEQISKKFTAIEAEFDDWNRSRSCIFDNPIDTLEVCHDCTQAILHHGDDDDEDDAVGSGSEAVNDFFSGQQSPAPEKRESGVRKRGKYWKGFGVLKKERRKRGEKKRGKKGEIWEAFGCGMIFGALIIWVILNFSSSNERGHFLLLPPT